MEYTQSGDKFVGTISYRTNPAKPQITLTEKFNSMEQAKEWTRNKVKELDHSYAELTDQGKELSKEFELIMTQHAGDYKWSDNFDVDNVKATKVDTKKTELSVVTSKKEIYNKFKLINPNYELTADVLTADRKVHHLTHENSEYKYCSGCDKWVEVTRFPSNKLNYDSLDRRCKTCKSTLAKKYKANEKDKHEQDGDENQADELDQVDEPEQANLIQQGGQIDNSDSDSDSDENEVPIIINEKLNQIIQEKAGTLLTEPCAEITDRNFTVRIRCSENHEWGTKIKNVYRDIWCPICGLTQADETKEKISKKMTDFFATEKGKKSKEQALIKRSETMRARKEENIANIVNKLCKGDCGQIKSIDNFCKKTASADGYQSWCKLCTNNKKKLLRANANDVEIEL